MDILFHLNYFFYNYLLLVKKFQNIKVILKKLRIYQEQLIKVVINGPGPLAIG